MKQAFKENKLNDLVSR